MADSIAIREFPQHGQGQVKVCAYADDVSLFLRDEDSYATFLRLLFVQRAVGCPTEQGKSRALRFSAFASDLARGRAMEWVAAVKVLGMNFHASGEVVDEGWKEL